MTKADDASRARTWTALLAHWTEFARRASVLNRDEAGQRWRASVAPVIGLQAVTHALAEVDGLEPDERALGLDRAELLIRQHAAELHHAWRGEPMPEGIDETLRDAATALVAAQSGGLEWLVASPELIADHPAELVAVLGAMGFRGDLDVPTPGVPLFEGCVAANLMAPGGGPIEHEQAEAVHAFLSGFGAVSEPTFRRGRRLAYRQFDFAAGGPVRDVIADEDLLPPGQPLLVRAIAGGAAQPVALPPRKSAPLAPLSVEVFEEEA